VSGHRIDHKHCFLARAPQRRRGCEHRFELRPERVLLRFDCIVDLLGKGQPCLRRRDGAQWSTCASSAGLRRRSSTDWTERG
jgi:hypothetical protein